MNTNYPLEGFEQRNSSVQAVDEFTGTIILKSKLGMHSVYVYYSFVINQPNCLSQSKESQVVPLRDLISFGGFVSVLIACINKSTI